MSNRSFRTKNETLNPQMSINEFITFDRYDKMMVSKEHVMSTKSSFKR